LSLRDVGTTLVTCTATSYWIESSDVLLVHVRDTTPPVALIRTNSSARMHELVRIDGTGSTDNVGVACFRWSIEDAGRVTVLLDPFVFYEFDEAGSYLVLLEVRDAVGHTAFAMTSILVLDTEPPRADAGPDVSVRYGVPVVLDGRNSTDNVGIRDLTWEVPGYGSGRVAGPVALLEVFPPGEHTVRLTVRDAAGNEAVDEARVWVGEEGPRDREAPTDLAKGVTAAAIIAVLLLVVVSLGRMAPKGRA